MNFTDLASELDARYPNITIDAHRAFKTDLERLGVRPGPALQEAFERWSPTRKRTMPTPSEFAENYRDPPKRLEEQDRLRPDGRGWAKTVLLEYPEGGYAADYRVLNDLALWCREHPGRAPDEGWKEWIDSMIDAKERTEASLKANPLEGPVAKALFGCMAAMQRREDAIRAWRDRAMEDRA